MLVVSSLFLRGCLLSLSFFLNKITFVWYHCVLMANSPQKGVPSSKIKTMGEWFNAFAGWSCQSLRLKLLFPSLTSSLYVSSRLFLPFLFDSSSNFLYKGWIPSPSDPFAGHLLERSWATLFQCDNPLLAKYCGDNVLSGLAMNLPLQKDTLKECQCRDWNCKWMCRTDFGLRTLSFCTLSHTLFKYLCSVSCSIHTGEFRPWRRIVVFTWLKCSTTLVLCSRSLSKQTSLFRHNVSKQT